MEPCQSFSFMASQIRQRIKKVIERTSVTFSSLDERLVWFLELCKINAGYFCISFKGSPSSAHSSLQENRPIETLETCQNLQLSVFTAAW